MGKREDNKRRTEQRILDEGIRLLGGEDGCKVTVQDIADAAGVSRATFFNYFDSKNDIATAFGRRQREWVESYSASLPEDMPALEKVLAVLRADIDRVCNSLGNLRFARYLMTAIFSNEKMARTEIANWGELAQVYRGILEAGQEKGEVPESLDVALVAHVIVELYFSAQVMFLFSDTEAKECFDLIEQRIGLLAAGLGSTCE